MDAYIICTIHYFVYYSHCFYYSIVFVIALFSEASRAFFAYTAASFSLFFVFLIPSLISTPPTLRISHFERFILLVISLDSTEDSLISNGLQIIAWMYNFNTCIIGLTQLARSEPKSCTQ